MSLLVAPREPLSDGVVLLRPYRVGDAEAVAAVCDDEEAARWLGLPVPYRLADAEVWLEGLEERQCSGEELAFALTVQGQLLGTVSILRVVPKFRLAELGYLAAAAARGRGLVVRAVRLVSDYAFDELGLARLELRMHPDNLASARVAERAGFTHEGRLREALELRGVRHDAEVWGLLPGDRERWS